MFEKKNQKTLSSYDLDHHERMKNMIRTKELIHEIK